MGQAWWYRPAYSSLPKSMVVWWDYILGIKRKRFFLEMDQNREYQKLLDQLVNDLEFSGESWIVFLNANAPLAKALSQTAEVPIYSH